MDIKGIGNSGYDYIKSESIKTENTQVADPGQPLEIKEITSEPSNSSNESKEQPMSLKEQQRRMERLQNTLKDHNIEISYNDEVNRYAIRIMDSKSKEVVREIPSEKSLEMFARMLEIEGLLVDEKR